MTPAYEYTAATLLLTMALSPAQVPDWPKTQFGWQESCWAWVTETSPAKISARSEFIVDDGLRCAPWESTIVERDECAEALRRSPGGGPGPPMRRSEGGDLGHTFVGWLGWRFCCCEPA